MKNIIVLQKQANGTIYCAEISEEGVKHMEEALEEGCEDPLYWKEGGTITIEEIEEILDKNLDIQEQ